MSERTKIEEQAYKHRQHGDPRGSKRILAKTPRVSHSHMTSSSKQFAEDAGVAPAMSIAAGDPAKVTNPTDNYAKQKYRAQLKSKMLRRKSIAEGKLKGSLPDEEDKSHEDYEATLAHAVKQAKGIAFDKRYAGGNMTGAHNAISKLGKKYGIHGLERHPEVKSALSRSNMEEEVEQIDEISTKTASSYADKAWASGDDKRAKGLNLAIKKMSNKAKVPTTVDESMVQLTRTLSGREPGQLPPEKKRKEKSPLMSKIKQALTLRVNKRMAEESDPINEISDKLRMRHAAVTAKHNSKAFFTPKDPTNRSPEKMKKSNVIANKTIQKDLEKKRKDPRAQSIGRDYRAGKYQGD